MPKKKKQKKRKIVRARKGEAHFRVHVAGSGRPVTPYTGDRKTAERWALEKAKKTGRRYFVLKTVSSTHSVGEKRRKK